MREFYIIGKSKENFYCRADHHIDTCEDFKNDLFYFGNDVLNVIKFNDEAKAAQLIIELLRYNPELHNDSLKVFKLSMNVEEV